MEGDKKRRQGKQQTASRETTNGALTRGALDKKHITKTYRQGLPVCDCGGVGQQLSTIDQQFFLYSLFIGQQLSTISQQWNLFDSVWLRFVQFGSDLFCSILFNGSDTRQFLRT